MYIYELVGAETRCLVAPNCGFMVPSPIFISNDILGRVCVCQVNQTTFQLVLKLQRTTDLDITLRLAIGPRSDSSATHMFPLSFVAWFDLWR